MASDHVAVRKHSRGKGHSAAGAVAYRAGIDLADERTGEIKRFSRRGTRGDVLGSGIIGGGFAEGDFAAWATAVESAENRRNSCILRDIQPALPHELDNRQQEALLRRIAADVAERYHTTCTWHHHRADRRGDKRNRHGHILLATREVAEDGTFGKKLRRLDDVKTGPDEIKEIRLIVERRTNEALEAAGRPERISTLRNPDVEPDLPPQPTVGQVATAIERRAAAERRGEPVAGESIARTVRDGAATGSGHRLAEYTAAVSLDRLPSPVRAETLSHAGERARPTPPRPVHDLAALRAEAARREQEGRRRDEIARAEETLARLPSPVRAEALSHAGVAQRSAPRPPAHELAALRAEAARREQERRCREEIARAEETLDRPPSPVRAEALSHAAEPPRSAPPRPVHELAALRAEAARREQERRCREEMLPPVRIAPEVLPPARSVPEVLPPVRIAPEVLPPARSVPEVLPPVRIAPEVLPPARSVPEVLPPVRIAPEVLPPARSVPEVLPPRRETPRVLPPPRQPEVLPPARHQAAVFPPREVATRIIADELEAQHPAETAATLSEVERHLEQQRQTLAHGLARAAVRKRREAARKRERAPALPAPPSRIRRIADWVLSCARRILERFGLKPVAAPEHEVDRTPVQPAAASTPPSPQPEPEPRPEPTLWERYEARWPAAAADRSILEDLTKPLPEALAGNVSISGIEGWRRVLRGMFQGDSFPMRKEPPKSLPPSLAPAGEASRDDAALHAAGYAGSLPPRYRAQFARERIVERSLEAAEKVRHTLRYRRFAGEERRQTLQEDAIREACGEDAQRLDREMRGERRQWQKHWDVLVRHDTLLQEEKQERESQRQLDRIRESIEQSRLAGDRDPQDRGGPGRTM